MYSWAPRCSEAWLPRSTPACCRSPSAAAYADAEISRPAAKAAILASVLLASICGRVRGVRGLVMVMRRHPLRPRLGVFDLSTQRHRDDEDQVDEKVHRAKGRERVGG